MFGMMWGGQGLDRMVRRVTKSAEAIKLPSRRKHRSTTHGSAPAGPVLIPGRGLARRHPRGPLSSVLPWVLYLLLGAAISIAVVHVLLG
jgi:hypothetical protein